MSHTGHLLSWFGSWTTKEIKIWFCPYWKAIIKADWTCFHRRIRNLLMPFIRRIDRDTMVDNGILGVHPVQHWVRQPNNRHRPIARSNVSGAVIAWLHRPIPWSIRKILGGVIRSVCYPLDDSNNQTKRKNSIHLCWYFRTITAASSRDPCLYRLQAKRPMGYLTALCRHRIRWHLPAAEVDPTRFTATITIDHHLFTSPEAAWEVFHFFSYWST